MTQSQQSNLDAFFLYLTKIQECWESRHTSNRLSVPDALTLEELEHIRSQGCPKGLYDWAIKQYSKDTLVQTWAIHISRKDRCNGYEADVLNQQFLLGAWMNTDLSNKIKQKLQESIEVYATYKMQAKEGSQKIESFNIG